MTLPGEPLRRRAPLLVLALLASVIVAISCSGRGGGDVAGNLLQGRAPLRATEVSDPERLTDGTAAQEGDHWESDLASVFRTPSSSVEWDLGRAVRIKAAFVQGDNNDDFFLSGSEDGTTYSELWAARSVRGAGMRARLTRELDVSARYLRLTARGGDPAVSATEVLAFENVPAAWPPKVKVLLGKRPILPGERETFVFGIVAAAALLLHRSTWSSGLRALALVLPVVFGYRAWDAVVSGWPPGQPVIDMVRAVSAAVAGAAVIRIAWRPTDAVPRFVDGWLAAMAFLAMTTFYNMWQPQFDYQVEGRQTAVHTWDMRVYFPTAKYFDELGFDGLYLASVAAYLEDAPNADERRIGNVELRDLRNYEMTTVRQVIGDIRHVKTRFSPERWQAFKRDMSFFWQAMGPGGYLGSLRDHGGNATPSWMLVAYMMFRTATASEPMLLWAAALDPLLLAIFFAAVWRTFGRRTALVALVVYGTSSFPWFGSNWAGSTLRNDWMVLVGLGACALRKERWTLGGALLAGGAMIRAFPAMAVFFLPVPALWWLYEAKLRDGRFPGVREILSVQRPLFRALAGAAICVAVMAVLPIARFGYSHSWGEWSQKIMLHSTTPNVNHVGLRALFQYHPDRTLRALSRTGGGDWAAEQSRTLGERRPFYIAVALAIAALAVAAARGRDFRQASLLGMMLIPIFFYPSNYYLHYVFVLPLIVDYGEDDRRRRLWGSICAILLGICVSEYWGFDARGVDERYVQWSVGALVGFIAILLLMERDTKQPEPEPKAVEEEPPKEEGTEGPPPAEAEAVG